MTYYCSDDALLEMLASDTLDTVAKARVSQELLARGFVFCLSCALWYPPDSVHARTVGLNDSIHS